MFVASEKGQRARRFAKSAGAKKGGLLRRLGLERTGLGAALQRESMKDDKHRIIETKAAGLQAGVIGGQQKVYRRAVVDLRHVVYAVAGDEKETVLGFGAYQLIVTLPYERLGFDRLGFYDKSGDTKGRRRLDN